MADDDGNGEKTEKPTAKRRAKAREQGTVAKSPDLVASLLLIAVLMMLNSFGGGIVDALRTILARTLSSAQLSDFRASSVQADVLNNVKLIGMAMLPMFAGLMIIAALANVLQVGFHFNVARLQPRLGALSPIKGLSKLFDKKQTLPQLGMNLVKMTMVSIVAYSAIHGKIGQIVQVQQLSFLQIFGLGAAIVYAILIRIGVLLLILAILDYCVQRWRIEQSLKMSKHEIKEEMRSMDGDPKIKQRRRQIAMQRLMKSIQKDVPTADVIVTNPTHLAIALKYDSDSMRAPRVVAKGADFLAMRIREIAALHGIPIVERKPLARALYKMCDVGQEIPEQFYSTVAEILAYVYELSGKLKRRRSA